MGPSIMLWRERTDGSKRERLPQSNFRNTRSSMTFSKAILMRVSCQWKDRNQCTKTKVYQFHYDGRNLALLSLHGRVAERGSPKEVDGHTEMSLELALPLFVPVWRDNLKDLTDNYSFKTLPTARQHWNYDCERLV